MALPNMPSIYTTRKNIYEAAIVRRRTQEDDFRERWNDNSRYFNNSDIHSSKDSQWSSKQMFEDSMDAYKKNYEKDTKAMNMARRRSKLLSLYNDEHKQFEAELKGLSPGNFQRLEDMKERSESLRSAREVERKQIAEEKMYEHFVRNSPDIRKIQSEQHREHVIGKWSEQVDEKVAQAEREAQLQVEMEEQMERERLASVERAQQLEIEKRQRDEELAENLKQQIQELKEREKEAVTLKAEQEALLKERWKIEQIEDLRKQQAEVSKKQEHGRVLLRQHAAALRRRSRVVRDELEADLKVLELLSVREKQQEEIQTTRREKARADVAWMKEVLHDQVRLEREREAELDNLYQDEAARVWSEREKIWAKEKQARQRLMDDVLKGRQDQIQDKMLELQARQEESIARREEIVRDMERANQDTRRENEAKVQEKEDMRLRLESQMTSRKEKEERSVMDEMAALETERQAEQEYDKMLSEEAARLKLHGYQDQVHGRKGKQAWQ